MALLKTVHIICAVIWLGNFVVTGTWSLRAAVRKGAQWRSFAAAEILFTDAIFTLVFGAAVTATGIGLAQYRHLDIWRTFWTRTSLEILAAAAAAWLCAMLPLELRMRKLAERDERAFSSAFILWNAIGWSVTLALFFIVYLMVAQPA